MGRLTGFSQGRRDIARNNLKLINAGLLASTAMLGCLLAVSAPAQAQVPTPNANQWGLNLIGAPAAWALGYNGAGVAVAVGDTGIDTTHPAFAGKIDPRSLNILLPTATDPYVNQVNDLDPNGHGTHVAGIIAASGTSQAPGVAYNANLVVIRMIPGVATAVVAPQFVPGTATPLDYFAGLQNVMIYNASYGPNGGTGTLSWPATTINPAEAAAVQNVLAAGKIIVGATGNDRGNNPIAGQNPSGIPLYPFIQPANANAGVYQDGGFNFNFSALQQQPGLVVAVTSVGQDKTIAFYANYCGVTASWCVAAPGGDLNKDTGIYSTLPGGNYGSLQGTSMAAPMVSGALAVLQQAYPAYNAQDLARVMFATAENVGGQAADNAIYGYGLIRLDRAVAGPKTLAAGSNVTVAAQQMTYWSQPLTTGGSFTKIGDGYLNIAGRTVAAGDVAVNAGALAVDGTLTLNTRMIVAQGATLAGFGSINGNVLINGTLNAGQLPNYSDIIANSGGALPAGIPLSGTSPGTLTFQGSVTMAASATTRVNVDGTLQIPGGPGTYDKILISGAGSAFAAGGTLAPVLRGIPGGNNDYTPTIGTLFPFLNAQNGATVSGTFAGLTQPTTGLATNTRFDVVYSPTSITLSVTPLTFAGFAIAQPLNRNQRAVAQAIDTIRPAPGIAPRAVLAPLFNLLEEEDTAGDDTALTALSGQGQGAMPRAIMDSFLGLSEVVADRQAMVGLGGGDTQAALTPNIAFAYASARPATEARVAGLPAPITQAATSPYGQWTTWGQVYGRTSTVGDRNGLNGYNSNGGGFVVGADRTTGSNLLTGAAFGYAHASTTSVDTKGNSDIYSGELYATYAPGAFVFDGRVAGGATTTGTARTIVFPGASTTAGGSINGWGALAAGEAGYRFNVAAVTLKPYVGLTAQTFNRNAFTESSAFGLSFPAQTFTRVTTDVGVSASSTFQARGFTFAPMVKVAWAHDLRDDTLATQAELFDAPFVINPADPGRDAAVVGFKLAAWQTEKLRVFAAYTGEFRSNASSHQLSGGLRVAW